MACDEHKFLASYLKEVHNTLRNSASKLGAEKAWKQHCENKDILSKYAQCMQKLATTHWEANCLNTNSTAKSRIEWTVNMLTHYFIEQSFLQYRLKEEDISRKMECNISTKETFSFPIKLLDVGSCYNPFKTYEFVDVTAIDLCPANDSVYECDFLHIKIGSQIIIDKNKLTQVAEESFEVVTFCFLLEYIPTSDLRINACLNAYKILKPGGLLIITTPDSKHVGANSRLMKSWRYTLACLGFNRIKYEKFKHMHSMAFRKALNKDTAVRWATIHKTPNTIYSMHIPQDFNNCSEEIKGTSQSIASVHDFSELPNIL